MSDTPPPDAPAQDPPETPAAPATPSAVPEAPPADPPAVPVTKADLDAVAGDFRQAVSELGASLTSALGSTPSPVAGAGAPAPAPPPKPKDPRTWLQRVWFGPRRFS